MSPELEPIINGKVINTFEISPVTVWLSHYWIDPYTGKYTSCHRVQFPWQCLHMVFILFCLFFIDGSLFRHGNFIFLPQSG